MDNKYIDMLVRFGAGCFAGVMGFLFAALMIWLAMVLGVIAVAHSKTPPKPPKPQVEAVRKLDARTYIVGVGDTARVVRTVSDCRDTFTTGAMIERVGDVSILTFYTASTRYVVGVAVGGKWSRTSYACEIAKPAV